MIKSDYKDVFLPLLIIKAKLNSEPLSKIQDLLSFFFGNENNNLEIGLALKLNLLDCFEHYFGSSNVHYENYVKKFCI